LVSQFNGRGIEPVLLIRRRVNADGVAPVAKFARLSLRSVGPRHKVGWNRSGERHQRAAFLFKSG